MRHRLVIWALLIVVPITGMAALLALRQCTTGGAAPAPRAAGSLGVVELPCGYRLYIEVGLVSRIADRSGRIVLPIQSDCSDLSKMPSSVFLSPGVVGLANVGDVWCGTCEFVLIGDQTEAFWFVLDGSSCTITRFKELHEAIVHAADRHGVKWPVLLDPMDYAE